MQEIQLKTSVSSTEERRVTAYSLSANDTLRLNACTRFTVFNNNATASVKVQALLNGDDPSIPSPIWFDLLTLTAGQFATFVPVVLVIKVDNPCYVWIER
jgi:hypothetical protein